MNTSLSSQKLLENMPDGFLLLDSEWKICDLNKKSLDILKLAKNDLLGKHIFEAFPEAKGTMFETSYNNCFANKTSIRFEEYYKTFEKWYEVTSFYCDEINPGIGIFFRDITEKKQIQLLKEELISTLSLELWTPLTSIQGSIHLMTQDENSHLTQQFKSLLRIATKNTNHLVELIKEILDVETQDGGNLVFRLKKIPETHSGF